MNAQQILEELLNSGKELAEKGVTLAEAKLNIPEDGDKRDAMLSGAGKGALAAGALAILLGTRTGRKLTGTTLKLGSLAAIGSVAYKAFENWQNQKQSNEMISSGKAVNELTGDEGENRSRALLKAMIAAAKADGHIDEQEKKIISQHAEKLGLKNSVVDFISNELTKPLDAEDVAADADSPEAAAEFYLVSRMILNVDNAAEQQYLDRLTVALDLTPELITHLDAQIET